jgi:hypothetical protein
VRGGLSSWRYVRRRRRRKTEKERIRCRGSSSSTAEEVFGSYRREGERGRLSKSTTMRHEGTMGGTGRENNNISSTQDR